MSSKVSSSTAASTFELNVTVELAGLSQLARDSDHHILTALPRGWRIEHVFYAWRAPPNDEPRFSDYTFSKEPSLWLHPPPRQQGVASYEARVSHTCLSEEDPFQEGSISVKEYTEGICTSPSGWEVLESRSYESWGGLGKPRWANVFVFGARVLCHLQIKFRSNNRRLIDAYIEDHILRQLNRPIPSDVRFDVISKRRTRDDTLEVGGFRHVYAHSTVLTKCSEHFERLLNGSFAESNIVPFADGQDDTWISEYDYWSDSDLDEEEDSNVEEGSEKPTLNPLGDVQPSAEALVQGLNGRVVRITDAAYPTWKALIFYLQTGSITFASLTSTGKPRAARDDNALPVVSPKSMYRLAHSLEMTDLCLLSKQAIDSQLTDDNVLSELFSSFSARYTEFRDQQLDIVGRRRASLRESPQMRKLVAKIVPGGGPDAEETLVRLFNRLGQADQSTVSEDDNSGSTATSRKCKKCGRR